MFLANAFGIICLLVTLHLSNGFYHQYHPKPYHGHQSSSEGSYGSDSSGSNEKKDKVGTWIKANQDEVVRYHNEVRRKVYPPASDMMKMVWNDDAYRNSKAVAEKCSEMHSHPSKRVIEEPYATTCGENLYLSTGKDSWKEVIYDWFSEKEEFIYGQGKKTPKSMIGHYTQTVWASSIMIGCYYQKCGNLEMKNLYVCHYCPAGNMGNTMKTPYSKGKPCSKCKGKCEDKLCVN